MNDKPDARETPRTTPSRRHFTFGAPLLFFGCRAFERRYPRFAGRDFTGQTTWASRNYLEGAEWEQQVLRVIFDASDADQYRQETQVADAMKLMRAIASALHKLEASRAGVEIEVTAQRVKLTPRTNAHDASSVERIQQAFDAFPLLEMQILDDQGYERSTDRYYGACNDLLAVRRTNKVPFTLPQGITQKRYERLLAFIIARVQSNFREVNGVGVAMTALRVAAKSVDRREGGSAANAIAILDAWDRDLNDARRIRGLATVNDTPTTPKWPLPNAADEAALVERGERVYDQTIGSSAFMAWQNKSGQARMNERFLKGFQHAGTQFGTFFAATYGVDIVAEASEAIAKNDLVRLVELLAKVAPIDSKLRAALVEGARLSRALAAGQAEAAVVGAAKARLVMLAPAQAGAIVQRYAVD